MPEFDDKSAQRIVKAVQYVEGQYRGRAPAPRGARDVPYSKVGKLTTAITARSGSTPGFGMVQPYLITPTSMTKSGDPVRINNWTGSSRPSGTPVKYNVIDGYLWYDGNDCSGVVLP